MASSNPPNKNETFVFGIYLEDYANPGNFKANPTIAAGDFKISKDDGEFGNLATLPTVSPAGSTRVKISLSADEMNADNVSILCIDQTSPKEWSDLSIEIPTVS